MQGNARCHRTMCLTLFFDVCIFPAAATMALLTVHKRLSSSSKLPNCCAYDSADAMANIGRKAPRGKWPSAIHACNVRCAHTRGTAGIHTLVRRWFTPILTHILRTYGGRLYAYVYMLTQTRVRTRSRKYGDVAKRVRRHLCSSRRNENASSLLQELRNAELFSEYLRIYTQPIL